MRKRFYIYPRLTKSYDFIAYEKEVDHAGNIAGLVNDDLSEEDDDEPGVKNDDSDSEVEEKHEKKGKKAFDISCYLVTFG